MGTGPGRGPAELMKGLEPSPNTIPRWAMQADVSWTAMRVRMNAALDFLLGFFIAACTAQPSCEPNAHDDAETTPGYSTEPFSNGWNAGDFGPLLYHHVHACNPAVRPWLERELELPPLPPLGVEELIQAMDDGGVAKAALLSNAYFFAHSTAKQPEDLEAFRAENDRVAEAVAKHPERLVGFCGINPLAESAVPEMERCAADLGLTGVKLHLANSQVELRLLAHVERLGEVFGRANDLGLAIVIHMRTRHPEYGSEDAETFMNEILPKAPDVPVQIAHMAGWGGYDPATDSALGVFAEGLSRDDVYFDLSAVVRAARDSGDVANSEWWPETRYERLIERIGILGLERVVFGTDWPEWTPGSYRTDLETNLALSPDEFQALLTNRAPWLR